MQERSVVFASCLQAVLAMEKASGSFDCFMPTKVCLDSEWVNLLSTWSCLLLALSLVVKLAWQPVDKPILPLAVWLPNCPAAIPASSRNVHARVRAVFRNCLELSLNRHSLGSNWLSNYQCFAEGKLGSSLAVLALPLKWPISLGAPNVKAKVNKTRNILMFGKQWLAPLREDFKDHL